MKRSMVRPGDESLENDTEKLIIYKSLPGLIVLLMKRTFLVFIFCMALSLQMGTAIADLPVTGVPVSGLEVFDSTMQSFMNINGIEGGVLAVSRDGCVVYQRGFGYSFNGTDPLPENTPMRLASVEKPITAAMIHDLVDSGFLDTEDFIFDVGQQTPNSERRLLDTTNTYDPYSGVFGDNRFGMIRVRHLLLHEGGWDIEILDSQVDINLPPDQHGFDPQFENVKIANKLGISSPPEMINTVRYMLSQPLQFQPGSPPTTECTRDGNDVCLETPAPCFCNTYSNFGYMLLGLIVEQIRGQQHVDAIRQRVLTPDMWVPSTEIYFGRTFRGDQNDREPRYMSSFNCINVYNPGGGNVICPYGGWDHESFAGHGNLVASAAPLLTFMDTYYIAGPDNVLLMGMPLGVLQNWAHTGGLDGTSTIARQRDDGFNVVVLFNESSGDLDYAWEMSEDVYTDIDLVTVLGLVDWSTLTCIDGSWVDFYASSSGFGGYDDPFHTMDATLNAITDGTKLRIKPGNKYWTGTISTKTRIDAPFGTAIIGR
jgi:N-acyl-D-amino-acid deacylase